MKPFAFDLSPLVRFALDDSALGALAWRDFGNGSAMAKLARTGDTGAVVYRISAHASPDAFAPHVHTGGEAYLVLRGAIVDENGTYPAGSMVWLDPGSRHTPRGAVGEETIVVVLWPRGVEV